MSLDDFKKGDGSSSRGIGRKRRYTDGDIIDMYISGLSQHEVAEKAEIGQTQVHRILDKNDIEVRSICNSIDELKLSDKVLYSYITSVLACDGSVFKSDTDKYTQYIVTLNAKDYDFVRQYAEKAREFGFYVYTYEIEKEGDNVSNQLTAKSHHKEFYQHWKSLTPDDKMSICRSSREAKIQFLKGAYESEGSIWESPNLVVEISNEQDWVIECILESARDLGFDFGVKSRKPTKSGYMEKAFLSTRSEVKRFIDTIDPCIKRSPRNK